MRLKGPTTAGLMYCESGGDGQVVVLLHGVVMNGSLWEAVVDGLRDHCRCIVPELPFGVHRKPLPDDADLAHGQKQDLSGSVTPHPVTLRRSKDPGCARHSAARCLARTYSAARSLGYRRALARASIAAQRSIRASNGSCWSSSMPSASILA